MYIMLWFCPAEIPDPIVVCAISLFWLFIFIFISKAEWVAGSCEICLTKRWLWKSLESLLCLQQDCRKIMSKRLTDSFLFLLQAVRRQKLLEQSIQSAQEIEKSLHLIQESLSSIDKQLAAYIADKVDAAQMPQEAQASRLGMSFCSFVFYYQNKILLNFPLISYSIS